LAGPSRHTELRGIHTARPTALRSAASNSEIETGAITAATSASYGAAMHDVQRNDSAPCVAARRRTAPCGADVAQTGAALLRRTARSVNAALGYMLRSIGIVALKAVILCKQR